MKEYPTREKTEKHPVCECGHTDFDHELIMFSNKGKCEKCMCPKFNKETEMTIKEYANYQLKQLGLNIGERPNLREDSQ